MGYAPNHTHQLQGMGYGVRGPGFTVGGPEQGAQGRGLGLVVDGQGLGVYKGLVGSKGEPGTTRW